MKLSTREIYDIGKKLLKESTIGFEKFLNAIEFSPITENPYVMVRDNDELAAFMLFDLKEYEASALKVLKTMLEEIEVPHENFDYIIKILRDSYVSLFRIEKKEDNYLFYDVILDEYNEVYNYTNIDITRDEFGLYRVFQHGDKKALLQVIQIMDEKLFFTLSENIDNLFQHLKENYGPIKMDKNFLKREFLNIISILGVSIESINKKNFKDIDFDNTEEMSELEDLLNKFHEEDFLVVQNYELFKKIFPKADPEFIMGFFIDLFSRIYSNFLFLEEKTFKDYDLDYKKIFKDFCESGDFFNREDLSNSLDFLIIFYGKLLTMGRDVKNILKDLNDIKENIFYYLDLLQNSESGFYYDDNIIKILLENKKSVFGNTFVENFDNFLTFLDMNYVNLLKSGDLSPSMLAEFAKSINLKAISDVKTYKNKHFPLIELYLNFTVKKYLTLITQKDKPEELYLTDYAENYQVFDEATKLSLWIEALTNKNFIKSAFGKNYEKYRDFVIGIFKKLRDNNSLKNENFNNEELALLNILKDLDLLDYRDDKSEIKLTNFGGDIYNYYNTERTNLDNIIKVDFK